MVGHSGGLVGCNYFFYCLLLLHKYQEQIENAENLHLHNEN